MQGDAAPTCVSPLSQCGASCTDPQSDPNNCGACGTKCDTTKAQVCSQGKCALSCGGGTTQCGSSCFDTQVDSNNCGACGTKCAAGEQCSAGKCAAACAGGQTLCPSASEGGAPICADPNTDDLNCGKCGNACGVNQRCTAGVCLANLVTVSPTDITGGLANCTTQTAQTAHKVAMDGSRFMSALMNCGGEAFVVTSATGGLTWSAPVTTGIKSLTDATIATTHGANPVLLVAGSDSTGHLWFTSSKDGGATWATPVIVDSGVNPSSGLRVDSYQGTVYISERGGQLHILRNGQGAGDAGFDGGEAGFQTSLVNVGFAYGDVMVNQANGDVWFASDSPNFQIIKSTDGAATFSAPFTPPGNLYYSDWFMAKDDILGVDYQDRMYVVPVAAPTTSTFFAGLGTTSSQQRTVTADDAGNAYVATGAQGGGVKLTRVPYAVQIFDGGADAGAAAKSVVLSNTPNAVNVSVAASVGNAALYSFTLNGKVLAGVQTF